MRGMQAQSNRLRDLRKEQSVTLHELALLCGVYTSTVSHWQDNEIPQKHFGIIAERLGVSVAYLTGWSDDRQAAA